MGGFQGNESMVLQSVCIVSTVTPSHSYSVLQPFRSSCGQVGGIITTPDDKVEANTLSTALFKLERRKDVCSHLRLLNIVLTDFSKAVTCKMLTNELL